LFGQRPAILVPLAFYLFTAITLPASLWWAAAINQLPAQLAAAGAIWFQLAYLRRGGRRFALAGVVMLVLGLLFSEKALLILPVVFALTLFYFTAGPPAARLRRALVDHRRVWLAYALVAVAYLVLYLALVPSQVGAAASIDTALNAVTVDVARAVVPAVFGGPYRWQQLGTPAIADPSTAVVVLSLMATVLIVVWSVVRRYRAIFAWVVIGSYLVANATIVAVTRGAVFGPNVVLEYRYSTDVALVIAVFAPLAILRIAGLDWHWPPQPLMPRGSTAGFLDSVRPHEPALTVTLTALLIVGSAVSTIQFSTHWHNDITPRFVATVRSDLTEAGYSVPLADLITPAAAAPPGLQMTWPLSTLLAPLDPAPTFLEAHHWTESLYTVDDTGHVRGAIINGPTNRPGPDQTCGWKVEQTPRTIPLAGTTADFQWVARVGYLASMDAETDVTVGDTVTHVRIRAGVNQFYVIGAGAIDEVRFSGLSYGTLCTDDVVVGAVEPLPETHP
jgi:hypothetical protein